MQLAPARPGWAHRGSAPTARRSGTLGTARNQAGAGFPPQESRETLRGEPPPAQHARKAPRNPTIHLLSDAARLNTEA